MNAMKINEGHMYVEGIGGADECPFCGNTDEKIYENEYADDHVYEIWWKCPQCGARALETYDVSGTNWYENDEKDGE